MKKSGILIFALILAAFFRVSAQVSVTVGVDEDEFLPGEPLPVAVKIINRSGQQLHFGNDATWLTFDVEALDNTVIKRLGEPSVTGEFDLLSSQMATKHVDISSAFDLKTTGRYRLTATVHIREWGTQITSKPVEFSIIHGGKLWEQNFGMPAAANQEPEMRKYTLDEANYLHSQIRLYVQVANNDETHIYRVAALGPMVSFGQPEAQVDAIGNLHVIWQSGSATYAYRVVAPSGDILQSEIYDYVNSRPRLTIDDHGQIKVIGGVRRLKAKEMPMVKAPDELN